MPTQMELMMEAERRGILPPEKAAMLAEARKRGLVGGAAQPAAAADDPVKAWRKEHPLNAAATDFVQGAGGMAKGVLNLLTPSTDGKNRGVGDLLKNPAADPTSGAHIAGQLLDPVAWSTGSNIARMAPYAKIIGGTVKQGVGALLKNLGVGAAAGGTVGALTDDDPAAGGGRGAVIGALANQALPPAARAAVGTGRWLKELVMPSPAKLAYQAAGDEAPAVINAMMSTQAQTPGSRLNAAQAAADARSPEFSALQRIVDAKNPKPSDTLTVAQRTARKDAIQSVGGTKADLASAEGVRAAVGKKNYPASFGIPIRSDKTLVKMSQNPFFQKALPEARDLAKANGVKLDADGNPSPEGLTEFLHYVKLTLDKHLGRTMDTALGATEKHAVGTLQDDLVKWIGSKNKAYETARAAHEAASKPINRMELGQELEASLIGPLGQERPGPFAGAVRKAGEDVDVTGRPRINVLEPGQRKVVESMISDLGRERTWKELASQGRASALERIGAPQIPPGGGFSFALSTAKNWFNRATGGLTEGGLKQLAVLMNDDPRKLAILMRQFTPAQRAQVQLAIERRALGAAGGVTAATEQP